MRLLFVYLFARTVPALVLPLPSTTGELSRQVAAASVRSIEGGHLRLLVTVPHRRVLACAHHLVNVLEEQGMPTRVFLNGVAALNTWSHRSGVLQSRCDVLGLGQVAAADGALLLVSPCNRPHKQVVTEYIEQTDWKTLQAVQSLLARAYDRPIIMLNADLEALVLHRHASRPVRPTFMADFVHAYYLATRPPSQSSFLVSECVAVRRAYPADWEVFASSNVHSSSSQPLETILKRCCKSKPYIADTLIEEGVNAFAGPSKRGRNNVLKRRLV
mmetsp:Transcript_41122/g.68356  ORF Transcript_41122/g.68356 Transcript_41122/m.68356 type:complete len:273 (+) Transcript_41122:67-885(+)